MVENSGLKACLKCASNDVVVVGARFNPGVGVPAVYGNWCRPCISKFTAVVPRTGWSGQFGGSHAVETMCFYDPFSAQELEAFAPDGNIE